MAENEEISTKFILEQMAALHVKIEETQAMLKTLNDLREIKKIVQDIHKLHFSKEYLSKDDKLKDKYLAEILIGYNKKH